MQRHAAAVSPSDTHSYERRSERRKSATATWIAAWTGAAALGVMNGGLREVAFKRMSSERAHRVSTATLVMFLAAYMRLLERRQPLPDRVTALRVGAAWAGLTILFEFGFGRSVAKDSWADLLRAYDLRRGELWGLVPLWLAIGPEVTRMAEGRPDGVG